jgi:hypothetical protein
MHQLAPGTVAKGRRYDEDVAVRRMTLFARGLALAALTVGQVGCLASPARDLPGECSEGWWKHVVSPSRLEVYEPCMTVRGTVLFVDHANDGDVILFIALDAPFLSLPHIDRVGRYGTGTLELELICRDSWRIFQPACWGLRNRLPIPAIGDHIEVDGTYVLDKHHGWVEIHPVTRLTVLGKPLRPSS